MKRIYYIRSAYDMRKSLEKLIEEKLKLEEQVVEILSDAAYAERFISKPNNNRQP